MSEKPPVPIVRINETKIELTSSFGIESGVTHFCVVEIVECRQAEDTLVEGTKGEVVGVRQWLIGKIQ